ncbi:hypothetical protein SAMN05443633_101224 [Chryseobacterium arachidis]|uniref:Uncharacterized protein n=1 Tax=Chryseobacterium arachidis TaxID=1416778 RepID=A0A1M4TFJ6_9FLAO|nr:hypothetical protein [Chryseobacterium arachidis]SHE43114.1 hypothetical protein SAMN05443633_101224 [Chryseobacterium arachidis]
MRNKNLILNYVFLSCLIVLFLNDHFFKFQYTSWLTGKLSDIVGIVLLPMLLTYLFPKLKENSVFAAGLFFSFWKSPFSESFIKWYNLISPISIHRVVDESDLLVLLLLPVPYFLIKNIKALHPFSLKKIHAFAVLLPTIFVLMSTSPGYRYNYLSYSGNLAFINSTFTVAKPKDELIDEFKNRNINIYKDTTRIVNKNKWKYFDMVNVQQQNLHNNKAIFRIADDSIKRLIVREIEQSGDYKIDKIKIGDQTIENIQFYMSKDEKTGGTYMSLKSMTIEKNLREAQVERKLRKVYKKLLEEEFKKF